ncbi:hypothetical protein Drorol1_Dr00017060 [Drosera rotundifolia]
MAWWERAEGEIRVLIAPDHGPAGGSAGQLLSLQHPKSGISTTYLFVDGALQELNWFKQPYGSWFLGDYVCEDGGLYLSTPIDPLFILLPIFDDARSKKGEDPGKFRQMEEIIFVEGRPGYRHLLSVVEKHIPLVCDVKEVGSMKFFRLNDTKVLSWLCIKVNRVIDSLLKLSNNYAAQDEKQTLCDAVSIVGEYLKDETWLKLLCNHLRLELEELNRKAVGAEAVPSLPDNAIGFSPIQEIAGTGKKKAPSNGRQVKKMKEEKDSHNIKDLFSRATRRSGAKGT